MKNQELYSLLDAINEVDHMINAILHRQLNDRLKDRLWRLIKLVIHDQLMADMRGSLDAQIYETYTSSKTTSLQA